MVKSIVNKLGTKYVNIEKDYFFGVTILIGNKDYAIAKPV